MPKEFKTIHRDDSESVDHDPSETTEDTKPVERVRPRKVRLVREFSDSDEESQASYYDPNSDPFGDRMSNALKEREKFLNDVLT